SRRGRLSRALFVGALTVCVLHALAAALGLSAVAGTASDTLAFRAALTHPTMAVAQGEPAVVRVGDPLPGVKLSEIAVHGRLFAELVDAAGKVVGTSTHPVAPGAEVAFAFPG